MMGNFGDMMKLMSHAKDIQAGAKAFKDELPNMEFSAVSEGGRVKVAISGDFHVKSVQVSPDALSDRAELEKELAQAFDNALSSAKLTFREKIAGMMGGIGLDGLL